RLTPPEPTCSPGGRAMSRSHAVAVCLLAAHAALAAGEPARPPASAAGRPARVLPGLQSGGAILLPNGWSLRPPGQQVALGAFPVNLALHPPGRWLAALHAGYGTHETVLVDLKTQKVASRVTLDQAFYGLCYSPDGRELFASGGAFEVVHAFAFEDGLLS